MRPESLEFFKSLINAPGPSGFEESPRRVWRDYVAPFADSSFTGSNGSEVMTVKGKDPARSLLLMGHIDQIGLIVRYIDDDGFLFFAPIGGVDPDTVMSQVVRVLGPRGEIPGVVGKMAIHLQDAEERKNKLKLDDLWIDIGAKNRAEAEQWAPIGTPIIVGSGMVELLNGRVAARMDNRFGAFVVAEVLRRLKEKELEFFPTIHGAATVQEESSRNLTGAATVAWKVEPSAAIAVDVTHSVDIPGANKRRHGAVRMGSGPVISVGVSSNNRLTEDFRQACASAGLRVQIEAESGAHSTDADAMAWSRSGIPALSLGVPLRYMHNTVEMAELEDLEAVVDALEAFIVRIPESVDYTP